MRDTTEENVTTGLVRMQNNGPAHEVENESVSFPEHRGIFPGVMPFRSNLVSHSSLHENCNFAGSPFCEDFRTQSRAQTC